MVKRPLPGSERRPVHGAEAIGHADGSQRLEVTVLVRRRDAAGLRARLAAATGGEAVRHLTQAEFADAYGADPADIAKVTDFAKAEGLTVVQADPARRTVILSGAVAQFEAAFAVQLQDYEFDGGSYRGREGPLHVPDALAEVVEAVLGLDDRPVAHPHFRVRRAVASLAGGASFTPPELARLYGFPKGDGKGQCIAIIELGGGYRPADLKAYFAGLKVHPPKVKSVGVDHAANRPTGDPNGPDGEVMLDIEIAGAVAPGARIVVYFAPNTDAGFLNAITTAAHDTRNKPSVISISWGGPESSWTAQSLAAYDSALQDAAILGVTVLAASGDNGSSDGVSDGAAHVDFPASSPHITACGGTRLSAAGDRITGEQVWNDGASGGAGGGGVSAAFDLPAWQQGLSVTSAGGAAQPLAKRGVPDIAADADPQTGYEIRVDGHSAVFGGTSAVAPLWAGLIAIANANNGRRAGLINPVLYKSPAALRDITSGDNGAYKAAKGWDACTGLGSPDGAAVAEALKAADSVA